MSDAPIYVRHPVADRPPRTGAPRSAGFTRTVGKSSVPTAALAIRKAETQIAQMPNLAVGAPPLTSEQLAVVEQPVDARVLVTADAGTGKTHALVARIEHLITDEGLSAGSEVLVLSFSRAAVRAVGDRLRSASTSARMVRARTFDSFATGLLARVDPDGPWQDEDYDGRIRRAVELLRSRAEAREELRDHRHVFVDEAQDLVGDRADLVQAILEAVDGGFTILGDPAQGIYTFQLEDAERQVGSRALYEWLRSRFDGDLIELRLAKNFRALTTAVRAPLSVGRELNATAPDYDAIWDRLRDLVTEHLPSRGELANWLGDLDTDGVRTAILCRDNGQALVVSNRLRRASVPHLLQRAAVERAIEPWVGRLLSGLDAQPIGRRRLFDRFDRLRNETWPERDEAWAVLKRLDRGQIDSLDVARVARGIREQRVPDELTTRLAARVVVSTVHRAKGLEFDRVLVVEPLERNGDLVERAEETRVLYVALTRARRELWHLSRPNTWRLRHDDNASDRWYRLGDAEWKRIAIEVRGDDVDREEPSGAARLGGVNAQDAQRRMTTNIAAGDPVVLRLVKAAESGAPQAIYAIDHDGQSVGTMSSLFARDLWRVIGTFRHARWPTRIEDVWVESVDTVAGTGAAGMRAGLAGSGIWNRIRVQGLGRLIYCDA